VGAVAIVVALAVAVCIYELDAAIATARAAYPKLLRPPAGPGHFFGGVDDAELDALKARVTAGKWDEPTEAAVWVVLEGFSREQGPAATYGRNLTSDFAGLAAASGDRATLEGVGRILSRFLADQSHPYSIIAQALLSEKIRCGAASLGADDLVKSITKAVNPDKEFDFGTTDGTVADRYGIHDRADCSAWRRADRASPRRATSARFSCRATAARPGRAVDGNDEPLYAVAYGPATSSGPRPRGRSALRDAGQLAAPATPFARARSVSTRTRPRRCSRSATSACSSAPRTGARIGRASRARRT
jgi:hypothetical protein